LILPPLLPFLIALGGLFQAGGVDAARGVEIAGYINNVGALLLSITAYRLLCPLSNRVVAVAATLTLPLFLPYLRFANSPLTEMLFMLGTAMSLLVLGTHLQARDARSGVVLGLTCALVALTRQAGLFVIAFCVLWIAIDGLRSRNRNGTWNRQSVRKIAREILPVVTSFALLYGIYGGAVYLQTQ
jgi:4-amino-4-deoxy-L-arabinose transferase-like glycosyltransferase